MKSAEQLGFDLKSTSFNTNQMQTLQDLFFECANRAIKVKAKYEHFLDKDHPKDFKDINHDFRINPSKININ